jgi:hypothetical protein
MPSGKMHEKDERVTEQKKIIERIVVAFRL